MTLLVFCLTLNIVLSQGFTPGCSFYNGQCVYKVQLGHEQQCDVAGTASTTGTVTSSKQLETTGGCSCNDVTTLQNEIGDIQTTLSNLQTSVGNLYKELNVTQTDLTQTGHLLEHEKTAQETLLAQLDNKEKILNQTKEELANVLQLAKSELDSLRQKLVNAARDLSTCQGNLGITPSTPPAVTADYTTFYCGFESSQGLCNFTQTGHSKTDSWVFGSSQMYSRTGPDMDHTYGSPKGRYMYIDGEYISEYHSSSSTTTMRLTSQTFQPASHYCIRFWYNTHGSSTKPIKLYTEINGGLGYPSVVVNPQNDVNWRMAEVELDSEYTAVPFKIVFEGTTDAHYRYSYTSSHSTKMHIDADSNVAIDDIYVYNTTCQSVPACPAHAYTRKNMDNTTSCYTIHSMPATWYDAEIACKLESYRGHLATVTSSDEQMFLVNLIQSKVDLMLAGQNGFYIGGNDEKSESHFVWIDSEIGHTEPLNYTNWHIGQPNNVGANQDCMMMQYPGTGFDWGDVSCTETHPFICEVTQ